MLGSINTNTSYTNLDEMIEISCNFFSDVVKSSVQISQSNEVAVTDVVWVTIVIDITYL